MTACMAQRWTIRIAVTGLLVAGLSLGCTYVPNQFKEDGPSTRMTWNSPSAEDVLARHAANEVTHRDWQAMEVSTQDGSVYHPPVYFEDPFVDKGDGRTDETNPHNVYRGGWEDYVALAYVPSRFTSNWILFPVSMVVTTPWTVMVSDGELSRQLLGYDHDAARTPYNLFHVGPPAQSESETAPSGEVLPEDAPKEGTPG